MRFRCDTGRGAAYIGAVSVVNVQQSCTAVPAPRPAARSVVIPRKRPHPAEAGPRLSRGAFVGEVLYRNRHLQKNRNTT